MGGKGGYAIYVGSLTVPLHNAWADSAIKYQKEKYPDMFEVTSRLPVAESIDKSYATAGPDENLSADEGHHRLRLARPDRRRPGGGQKRAKDKIAVVGIAMPAQAALT